MLPPIRFLTVGLGLLALAPRALPAVEILLAQEDIRARFTATAGPAGLTVEGEVEDPRHSNDFSGSQLWRGDCLYLAFDGRGDSLVSDGGLAEDDGLLLLGLGRDGPEAGLHEHGQRERLGALPRDWYDVRRDDARAVTSYRLNLPWDVLGSAPGATEQLGLALLVAHKTASGADLPWGSIRARAGEPRRLHPVAHPAPAGPFVSLGWGRLALPGRQSRAAVAVAVRPERATPRMQVRVTAPAGERMADLAPGADGAARALVDFGAEDFGPVDGPLTITVIQEGREVARESREVATMAGGLAVLDARLAAALAAAPTDSPARWHLASLRVLAREVEGRTWLRDDREWEETAFAAVRGLLGTVPAGGFDLSAHLRAGLPLVDAFISTYDGSVQFSTVQLPPDWESGVPYPLVVYLHGAGPRSPEDYLLTAVDNSHQDTLWRRRTEGEPLVPQNRCILLSPYGRGTQGYTGAAESDVWQALERIEGRLSFDPDRRYLTGFSMGCNGAWRLANLKPDLWAGINLAAGFGSWSTTSDPAFGANLVGVPVAVWCGELDPFCPAAREFAAALPEGTARWAVFAPNTPHTYPFAAYGAMLEWLFQFRRGSAPESFSFQTPDRAYPGRNGVWMSLERSYRALAAPVGFSCRREDLTLHLTSEGVSGFTIEPGRLGLPADREIVIRWNGAEVWRGVPGDQPVAIGDAPARPAFRHGETLR